MKKILLSILFSFIIFLAKAQDDSLDNQRLSQMINLSEVVIRTDLNIPKFIERVKKDTTFYKAFKNLHILGFTSLNDIRMMDKKGNVKASLQSKTQQHVSRGCRTMDKLQETVMGDMYDDDSDFNYYTAKLYGSLFFTKGSVCGETNIVKGTEINPRSKSGIDKHKEQLKMLFFNPGKKIPGIPFMGDKSNIFDPDIAVYYDMSIDTAAYDGKYCYVFSIKAKDDLASDEKDKIVFDNMTTWFDCKTMEIVARNYDLSYDAGVYDFSVHMEVQLTRFGNLLVPKTLRYNGTWDVVFKKKERGVFTATLFDFR